MIRAWRDGGAVSWIAETALAFVLAAALIWPIFRLNYSDKWPSIESTFIADARFLRDHWPHPRWQPLWYTGTRFDYIYPPALRYGTAVISKLHPRFSTARAYHIYVGLLYALGIAGVYVLARTGGRSRSFALIAALAVATVSPSFLFFEEIRNDARGSWSEPQRLGVLVRYGEGPHMSAVALLGFALAFSMQALTQGGRRWIIAAAVACALVVSHNFYGATALAMLFPVVLWSWWVTHLDARYFWRAAGVIALSYGLCAFWLVPSYFSVTLDNMRFVSERGNRWSLWITVGLIILYLKLSERWARGRKDRAYSIFLMGALLFFTVNVIGNRYVGFRIVGEPGRMMPELDLVILLAGVEVCRGIWEWPGRSLLLRRAAVACVILLMFYSVRKYIRGGWHIFVPDDNIQARLEYQMTDWIAKNRPQARTYTTGTLRFWFNAWQDLAQLGGGSEQGLLNPVVQPSTWHLGMSEDGEFGMLWMQATGVDLAAVHDERSLENYKDIKFPRKFDSLMPVVYDDHAGNRMLEAPRRYRSLGRVVESAGLESMSMLPEDPPKEQLRQFVDLVERGPDARVETQWAGTDEMRIRARLADGQSLFLFVPYDAPWHAYSSAGGELRVSKSELNFMRIDAPPGEHEIRLVFELPFENLAGWIVTLLSLGVVATAFAPRRKSA